jgi:peptide/nickel transport system substrate-binding protein
VAEPERVDELHGNSRPVNPASVPVSVCRWMRAGWRRGRIAPFAALILLAYAGCRVPAVRLAHPFAPGSTIVASVRAEPRSFNRYLTRDLTSDVIAYLSHGALVRVNRRTQQLDPELAESWDLLPDGVTYRLKLRHDVRFSDGAPFSSADVVFSFRAIYDTRGGMLIADSLYVRGKALVVAAVDPLTVTIRFPAPFGPGLRLIEGIPIVPRHRLEAAYQDGKFASAWGLTTPPSELAGLGPFVLRRYEPGQRLIFDRNPHYWRRTADGRALPAADHVVLEIVPDQDAEQLRMIAGDLDFTQSEIRPSDYALQRRAEAQGRLTLTDLGPGIDGDLLWFNLTPAKRQDQRSPWLQHVDFRRAVSHAIDRNAFVNDVYLGAAIPAYGVVSPGNRDWYAEVPVPRYDPAAAHALLDALGLRVRDRDGVREDAAGTPVRFSLLTQKGNTSLERGAAVIRDNLRQFGIQVDVVEFEVGALIQRFSSGDYDAIYFRLLTTDTDPSLNPDFWLSSGAAHVWDPAQTAPATAWEQEIERLMDEISTSRDQTRRVRLFGEVQRIMGREVPVLCFAFPRLWFAMSSRISQATPAPFLAPLLWNPSVITVTAERQ